MGADLLIPAAVLGAVTATAPLVLWLDARNTRLSHRVEVAMGARRHADVAAVAQRSIRVAHSTSSRIDDLGYRVFRIPTGLPLAHVMPVWLVFFLSAVAGAGTWLASSYFVYGSVAVAVGCAVGFGMARAVFNWELSRYQNKLIQQLPDTIELVVSATRAGLPVAEAFRAVQREMPDPTRAEFSRMANEMALGLSPDEALMSAHRRTRVTEYAIFAVTVAVQSRSGGRISESIQNLAEIVRQRATVMAKAKALSAEARLSAQIISVLPFVGGGLMSFMHPGYLVPLFYDPRGKKMLVVGVCTLVSGMFLMRKLVNGVAKE